MSLSQNSFDPLDYRSRTAAMIARNKKAKELKSQGHKVKCWILKNQLKKYSGLGQPDGRVRDVFMLNIIE